MSRTCRGLRAWGASLFACLVLAAPIASAAELTARQIVERSYDQHGPVPAERASSTR